MAWLGTLQVRIRGGFAVPQYELIGVMQLGAHIMERLSKLPSDPASQGLYEHWLASEFTFPLRALMWGSARDRRAHMLLSLAVVAGGFATSGIAVAAGSGHRGSATSWAVFAIGLALAVVGGANQLFRPASRATERRDISVEMRETGWAFAMSDGAFAGRDDAAFSLFRERVSALQRRIAQIGSLEPASRPMQQTASRSRR